MKHLFSKVLSLLVYFMTKPATIQAPAFWKNDIFTEVLSPPTKIGSANFKSATSKKDWVRNSQIASFVKGPQI
jgi:hypothetical protein